MSDWIITILVIVIYGAGMGVGYYVGARGAREHGMDREMSSLTGALVAFCWPFMIPATLTYLWMARHFDREPEKVSHGR